MLIRPVFDPAVPAGVRDALAGLGERLPADPGAPLVRAVPGWRRRAGRDAVRAVGLGAVCALVPIVLAGTRMFGWAGKMTAAAGQVLLLAIWFASARMSYLWVAVAVSAAVQLVCTVGAFAWMDAWQLRRGVRGARGHYLVSGDFDPESRVMLARAQAAIDAVAGSTVAAAGLLDEAASNMVLSRQEWEIARALARRPGRGGGNTGLVVKRVETLERYAEQVREADEALAERHAASGADGPAESAALAEIDDLAEDARRIRDAIRAAPRSTGQASAGSPEPHPGDG